MDPQLEELTLARVRVLGPGPARAPEAQAGTDGPGATRAAPAPAPAPGPTPREEGATAGGLRPAPLAIAEGGPPAAKGWPRS